MATRLRHLPPLLLACVVLAVLAGLLGGFLRGVDGAVGAVAGVAVVVASYTFSTLLIAWADSVDTSLVLPFGLIAYVTKFTLIGVAMVAVAASAWPGLEPMGLGVVAGVVVWSGTQIWWVVRHGPQAGTPDSGRASDSSRPAAAREE
ncbi:MAG TPA: hypothetical protein VFZ32_05745 [Micromonosporaceae bacterium]